MSDSASLKATILVADDMEANRELLSGLLTVEGYTVVCAEDGDRALDAIHQKAVDLALLDVRMSGATGFSFRLVLPIIRHHHEKQDGSGYPDGLKGEEIPLTARILQITDVYDALTTERPYRNALQPQDAFAVMRDEVKRGWWDGFLLEELEALVLGCTPLQPARSGS
jgi:response regulator RpfG family c-di-GMP phosphodiesterase